MADPTLRPLGPLFGPDFVLIVVDDATHGHYELEVFPDAANQALKAQGLQTQFYYMPTEIHLAKKEDGSGDFDLSVTQFVGLMTEEDTLGVSSTPTTGGDVELGGAFISFSTTMAVPDSVVAAALAKLKAQDHLPAPPRILSLFMRGPADLAPLLGIVPIVDNKVTIEVPQLSTDSKSPLFISAQGAGQGSIEAAGISSFLVTCNEFAAGAIVGSLRAGQSPFTVHYNLTLMFYINACHIDVHVDVDKVFDQFSGAVAVKAGFFQADLSAKYLDCETSGGISTTITMNGAAMDPDIKTMVDKQCQDMQDKAWDMVKNEIFNWQPTADTPASASTGACGGAAVTLKSNYQKHGITFDNTLDLSSVISKLDTVSGTLSELQSAIKANLSKYLAIVDVGSAFQKIQVAATAYIDFSTADTADPISAAMIEVSYPDLDTSGNIQLAANGTPNLKTLGEGFHYTPTAVNLAAPSTLARWTRDNPNDIINIPFLRLRQDAPQWKADQVKVVKTLIYHSDDARVDLSTGGTQYQVTTTGTDNKPRVTPDEVGYIYVNFVLDRRLVSNETVTLTITIGARTDTLTIQAQGMTHPSAVWQVWSDKYFSQAIAKVKIDVEVAPPATDFSGAPVAWSGVQAVPVGLGRIKRIVPYVLPLPALTDPAQAALAAQYVLQTQKDAVAGGP